MTRTGLTDSHCHLDHFSAGEMPEILARTRQDGVDGMVTIGTRLSHADQQKRLAELDSPELRVWCTIGTHPDHVDEEVLPEVTELVAMADDPRVVGIGESGLDYFHGQPEIRPKQHESFRVHIDAARRTGLPLVIHTREADDDTLAILRDETESRGAFPFLIHCFSSGPALAAGALELGGYISFSGIATFNRAQAVRDVAQAVPADRLLVETDSPYLAPVPRRGKRNEPGYVAYTARRLAELRGMEDAAFAEMTTRNFSRLFSQAV